MAQWLRLCLPIQGSVPDWGTKISHALGPKNQNVENESNIVTNWKKTLKRKLLKKEEEARRRKERKDENFKHWTLVNDLHAEVFGMKYSNICNFLSKASKQWNGLMDG